MYWLIQDKFRYDQNYLTLCENLKRMNINHSSCEVIPFSDDGIISDIDLNKIKEPLFAFGSYTLSKIVINRKYEPGAFISKNSSMDSLLENYGQELFNHDMVIGPISEIHTDLKEFFVRPMEDTKSFTAEATTIERFNEFRDSVGRSFEGLHYSTVYPHTKVIISSIKPIEQECRFFVVDKKIVTYSQYRVGDTVRYSPIIDQYIIDYAEKIVSMDWQPDECYCLDIAISNGIPKVLEVNSINSSGLYAIDTQKFILAIEDLTEKYDNSRWP